MDAQRNDEMPISKLNVEARLFFAQTCASVGAAAPGAGAWAGCSALGRGVATAKVDQSKL
jgi:hypothetical protein